MLRIFAFTIVFLGCCQSYYYAIANGYTKAIKNNKSSNVKTINGNKTKITNNNVRKRTKIVGVIGEIDCQMITISMIILIGQFMQCDINT